MIPGLALNPNHSLHCNQGRKAGSFLANHREVFMVYLGKEQLAQVEYLFDQSANGVHILFDNETIRRVLSVPTENLEFFTFENSTRIQKLLSDFISKPSLKEKRNFLQTLDQETYDVLVRAYFNIVENSIFSKVNKLRH
jgi:hypothetical protein